MTFNIHVNITIKPPEDDAATLSKLKELRAKLDAKESELKAALEHAQPQT